MTRPIASGRVNVTVRTVPARRGRRIADARCAGDSLHHVVASGEALSPDAVRALEAELRGLGAANLDDREFPAARTFNVLAGEGRRHDEGHRPEEPQEEPGVPLHELGPDRRADGHPVALDHVGARDLLDQRPRQGFEKADVDGPGKHRLELIAAQSCKEICFSQTANSVFDHCT